MIGLERGWVRLVPYTNEWKEFYRKEEEILSLLLKDYVWDIQHVGSTSITGIDAKPIIDIIVGIKSFDYLPAIIEKLVSNGYIYRPESGTDERVLFVKGNDEIRTHHIHVVKWNEDEWNNHVLFRNYLNKHNDAAREYCSLKSRLAEEFKNDRESYTEGKGKFIQNIIMKAKRELEKS